jgi:hypothetical protein
MISKSKEVVTKVTNLNDVDAKNVTIVTNLNEVDANILGTLQLVTLKGVKCRLCDFLATDKFLLQTHSEEKHFSKTIFNKTFESQDQERANDITEYEGDQDIRYQI